MGVLIVKSVQHCLFFINQYGKQLKKKRYSLLLLFLLPLIFIAFILLLIISFVLTPQDEPITVAFVDQDKTTETALMSELLRYTIHENEHLDIQFMTEIEADEAIKQNELSAYIILPESFTDNLYNGENVQLPVIGNVRRANESYIVLELIESLTRYIESAQANILTVFSYADQFYMDAEQEKKFVLDQFMSFTLFTLGKGNVLVKETIENSASTSPKQYYSLVCVFILLTIWLLGFYTVIRKEEHRAMTIRLQLFGVTSMQKLVARIVVSLACSLLFALPFFYGLMVYVPQEFFMIDYIRVLGFVSLYAVSVLMGLAIIDLLLKSMKATLLVQLLFVFIVVILSGSIVPTIYFPFILQPLLPWIFSNEAFSWLVDIILEERNYADYTLLTIILALKSVSLFGLALLFTRWRT